MINFPNTPSIGDIFYASSNGIGYRWDGTQWTAGPTAGAGYGPTGDFFATSQYPGTNVGPTMTTLMPLVVSGNAGGWYNVANGRYTPPPGRYFLHADVSGNSSTAALGYLGVQLRKNGVVVQDNYGMTGYSYYAAPTVSATLDANGTDWFDMQANCNQTQTTSEGITFLAYPIAGAKGPPGDQGPPGVPGLRLIQRIVPTAGQANVDFTNIPVDINDIELRFDVTPATNGGYLYMQLYNGSGVLDTTNSYVSLNHYTYHTAAAGAAVTSYNLNISTTFSFMLSAAANGVSTTYAIQGDMRMNNIRDAARPKYFQYSLVHVEQTNTYYDLIKGGGALAKNVAVSGLHLYWHAGNFKAGGAVSLWGSP